MVFINQDDNTTGKEYILDTPEGQKTFLQFIPATVHQIINSGDSVASPTNNDNESNCVIVEKNILTDEVTYSGVDSRKYRPLIRGISDSVTIDDLVLITTIGPVGYYLGPLNVSNTPSNTKTNVASLSSHLNTGPKSTTYPSNAKFNRLTKQFKPDLDNPTGNAARYNSLETGKPILADIHTDLTFEGRHGNSIRLGSRNKFPNVIIDNGRGESQGFESINDSSIFAMFHQGSILEHFSPEDEFLETEPYQFKFADEENETPTNTLKTTFTAPLGRGLPIDGETDSDIESTIYDYAGAFSILNSDRIIINARKENMFLAAKNHIHFGSGNSFTITSDKNTLINSTERFDINAPEVRLGSQNDDETEPIVLGDQLVIKLSELCVELDNLIKETGKITVMTTQGESSPPLNKVNFSTPQSNIKTIKSTLEDFLSVTNRTT